MIKVMLISLVLFLFGCQSKDKEEAALENDAKIRQGFLNAVPKEIPPLDTSKKTYSRSNPYGSAKENQ